MTVVKLFKVEEPEQTLAAVFDDGDHVIGRGTYLSDKRISRRHGLLKVAKDGVTLTAVHQNPCYYKTEAGDVVMLLKDESITLRSKTEFSCLRENSWLKVVICDESQSVGNDPTSATASTCNKRKNTFDTPGTSQKIAKTDDTSTLVNSVANGLAVSSLYRTILNEDAVPSTCGANSTTEPANNVLLNTVKEEPVTDEYISAPTTNVAGTDLNLLPVKKELKQELESTNEPPVLNRSESTNCANGEVKAVDNGEQSKLYNPTENGKNNADPSAKRKWRDRCWYGKSCYRKNPEHKASFSHLGDSDYDTDPDDVRPSCSYGNTCYRRNPAHRRDFKHPSNGGPKPKNTRTKPTTKKQTPTTFGEYDDAEDDYDLEDPFSDDDSEDDFQPDDDDDTDSEGGDLQEIDEEDDTKQLLKEAKRITKNKTKK